MKKEDLAVIAFILMMFGCGNSPPKAVEIKDICLQPIGTDVEINGYISLPNFMERIVYRKGSYVSVTYILF